MSDLVLVIVAPAGAPGSFDAAAAQLEGRIPGLGPRRVLAPGEAAEWPCAARDRSTVLSDARDAVAGLAVDVNLLPAAGREKRLLIADMDSTIIEQECLDELAEAAGVGPEIAAVTERAMRGELDFETALAERLARLAGLPEAAIADTASRLTLTPGARTLTATMRARGGRAVLVSGGFTVFTGDIAARAGFDDHRANTLEIVEGRLTGRAAPPILGRSAKAEALRAFAAESGLGPEDALAVGDGANDLDMIRAAGLGVAFRAKPAVAEAAAARVDHADLTALLYLQGLEKTDFATG